METQTQDENLVRGGRPVNRQQADVVDHVAASPVTVVAAGAGSGKTYTTIATVLHLIATAGASVDQFVLITFTNKAANQLRDDIQNALDARARDATTPTERFHWRQQQERLAAAFVGTIHSFCRRLLRLFGYLDGVAHDAGVTFARRLRDEVIADLLETHLGEGGTHALYGGRSAMADYDLVKLVGAIYDEVRNQGLRFEDVTTWTAAQPDDEGKPYRLAAARFVEASAAAYSDRKREEHVLDSHDLLQKTADLLASADGEAIVRQLARRYRYLFVDEFQDTDAVQLEVVERLVPHLAGTLVVGDRKQSIYAFRGARDTLLEQLALRHTGRAPLPMSVSRRPTEPLLQAQNALFGSMASRYPFLGEPLDPYEGSSQGLGDPPPVIFAHVRLPDGSQRRITREDRIRCTARVIRWLHQNHTLELAPGAPEPVQPGHVVVLTRTNRILDAYARGLRAELADDGIDVRPDAGEAFYAQPEIASTTYMLQLLLAYPDDATLSLALDTPYLRGADASEEVRRQVQQPAPGNPLSNWFEDRHSEYHGHVETLQRLVRSSTVPQLLEHLYRLFRIREHYEAADDADAVQNLEYLREVARSLFSEDQALTLHTFVDFLRLATLTNRQEEPVEAPSDEEGGRRPPPPYVRVMTIHKAKGLEYPVVVIPEVQAPLLRDVDENAPPFLVINRVLDGAQTPHGLEVGITLLPDDQGRTLDTRSDAFRRGFDLDQADALDEEMRTLYVAVTRGEHVVVFVGSGSEQVARPGDEFYSWKDELLRARGALTRAGAQFGTCRVDP